MIITNTETFQYLGPQVYLSPSLFIHPYFHNNNPQQTSFCNFTIFFFLFCAIVSESTVESAAESTATTKNWENNSIDSYLIAGVVSCFLMLIICIIIIVFIIKRKRRYRRTPMPLWTIELKREDTCRSSFTDYSDVDVMYLDDSYLMDSPSELFSASTDSINERIGYHTLS